MFKKGKVRDIHELSNNQLLMVATDRISAFDVVMRQEIPGKGEVLTQLSEFWFRFIEEKGIVKTHFVSAGLRAMIVKKARVIPIEFIVRGYLAGSAWKKYRRSKPGQGLKRFYPHLQKGDKFLQPIVEYTTKAEVGHDQELNFGELLIILENWLKENNFSQFNPKSLAINLTWKASAIYERASKYAASRGVIIADTKFEFGVDAGGEVLLVDEVLTPDSSRFWLREKWQPGERQEGYDKQPLRNWLERRKWNKNPPPPDLSEKIIKKLSKRYQEILKKLTT